jgi:3',5'-cyclic-AMP phosphodiesterase
MAPLSFIHLTDLHMANPAGNEPHLFSDTSKTLSDVLAMIGAMDPRPSFIIVSGDVANNEDAAAYGELKRVWGTMDVPTFFALGNHDSREGFQSVMLGKTENLDAPYFHDAVVDGIHIITLDSKTPRSPHGSIIAEQFDWFEETLDEHAELPKLVVLHHPPIFGFESPDLAFETLEPDDSARFLSLIKDRNIVAVLCGHVHQPRVSVWNGIPVVVGIGHHSMLDVLHTDGIRGVSGAGFSLCRVLPTGLTVNFIPLPSDGREVMRMSHAELTGYAEKLKKAS